MQAEIITIGDEILIGQIVDSNSAWMAQQLNSSGIEVARITSIGDTNSAINQALNGLLPETKLVLITGGLGPTNDDITKKTLADYFGMELVFQPEIFEHITQLFTAMGRVPSALNKNQALIPLGCKVLHNQVGTAPGMLFEQGGRYFVSMPGVPYEMKYIMQNHVLPLVASKLVGHHIIHRTLLTVGIPESELAVQIADIESNLPSFIKLAYLPRPGMVRLRLSARGRNRAKLKAGLDKAAAALKENLGRAFYGEDTDNLSEVIGKLLVQRNETLATAESCTGGYLAHLITAVPGSSRYYLGSILAYANRAKTDLLDVKNEDLALQGAVSEAVVVQMAEGAKAALHTTWALATSGIAGPDGGTPEKPVGTVWIAIAGPNGTAAQKFQFGRNRERNIIKSANAALDMLRNKLIA